MRQEKKFILALQRPLGIIKRPLDPVARRLFLSPRQVEERICAYKKQGVIRRFGAVLAHQRIGLTTNVLTAWKVPVKKINAVARVLALHPAVTHCYLRKAYAQWPYNLYAMVHARTKRESQAIIRSLKAKTGIRQAAFLLTLKELKKTKADLQRIL